MTSVLHAVNEKYNRNSSKSFHDPYIYIYTSLIIFEYHYTLVDCSKIYTISSMTRAIDSIFDPLSRFVLIVDTIVDKVIAYFRRLLSFYFSRIDIFINVESMFFTLSSSRLVRSTLLLLFLFNDSVLVASRPFNCVYAYHLMHRSNSAFRLFTREHKHYE